MISFSLLIIVLGVFSIFTKKNLLGMVCGIQLVFLGLSMAVVFSGVSIGETINSQVFSLFLMISGVLATLCGYAFTVRLFYLNKSTDLEYLEELKK